MKKIKVVVFVALVTFSTQLFSQTLTADANSKMKILETLISELKIKNIDSYKEQMTLRVAEVFLKYADWDEANISFNTQAFKKVRNYKTIAQQTAEDLADFERNDVIVMLDESIETAKKILNGNIHRVPFKKIDWTNIEIKNNELLSENTPVFLSDYTWKPETAELEEFFGQLDGVLIGPMQLEDKKGKINHRVIEKLNTKPSGKAGFVFINNNKVPDWTVKAYGQEFNTIEGKPFTAYDIDNPGAREMMAKLFKGTVPLIAGKTYTQLGYMLTNEPRWANYTDGDKKVYFRADVSHYTTDKFIKWLKSKHGSLETVNELWGTGFLSFDDIATVVPLDISEMGSPKWYDWTTFNQERVTDWFIFLKNEILKYDTEAKVHLKIMPSIFTDNDPDSGIDFEALTTLSDFNGNDVAAHYNNIREKGEWEDDYILGWRELYMGYDFLKSINPNSINFNSESHLLSTSYTRDLNMNPKYVRAVYWAAFSLGLNATQNWYWPRNKEGAFERKLTNAYGGSNNQQPRVTRELQSTIIDVNTFSKEITAIQQERKPIRIFYSKTTANQKASYMDSIFKLYEALNFEGLSLGFVTKGILERLDHKQWDVVAIYKTPQVTQAEIEEIQDYLNQGGKVVIDSESFITDEYGKPIKQLVSGSGTLIQLNTVNEIKDKTLQIVDENNGLPNLIVEEVGSPKKKSCVWRFVTTKEGKQVLSVINFGKENVQLRLNFKNSEKELICHDIINGIEVSSQPVLKPYEVYFVRVN